MQPAAAEVMCKARWIGNRPCSPPEPRSRLDDKAFDARRAQAVPGCNPSRAAANNDDLGMDIGHGGGWVSNFGVGLPRRS